MFQAIQATLLWHFNGTQQQWKWVTLTFFHLPTPLEIPSQQKMQSLEYTNSRGRCLDFCASRIFSDIKRSTSQNCVITLNGLLPTLLQALFLLGNWWNLVEANDIHAPASLSLTNTFTSIQLETMTIIVWTQLWSDFDQITKVIYMYSICRALDVSRSEIRRGLEGHLVREGGITLAGGWWWAGWKRKRRARANWLFHIESAPSKDRPPCAV